MERVIAKESLFLITLLMKTDGYASMDYFTSRRTICFDSEFYSFIITTQSLAIQDALKFSLYYAEITTGLKTIPTCVSTLNSARYVGA